MLERRLQAFRAAPENPLLTRADLVQIMIDAGTTDLRGQEVLRQVFTLFDDVNDLSAFEQQTLRLLQQWINNELRQLGAMRLDRNGPVLDTAAAIRSPRCRGVYGRVVGQHDRRPAATACRG